MAFGDWEDVHDALVRALALLADGDFLILGEPTRYPLPKRGLFGRRARPVATRYVQVLRIDDLYTAECVGATSLGGNWDMSDATIDRLLTLGWRSPDEGTREFDSVTPNFDMYVALTAAPTLAELLVDSLRLLGAPPEDLTLQTSQ
jgi:T3SS (YopN, CesT) and YbjN peptide-binding chaperone 3